MEYNLCDYYGWDPVWGGSIFGGGMPQALGSPNAVRAISWPEARVDLDTSREQVKAKSALGSCGSRQIEPTRSACTAITHGRVTGGSAAMAQSDVFALNNSGLEPFLFAEVGDELNGLGLTVLSVLARLGHDP